MTAVLGQTPPTMLHSKDVPDQPSNGFIAVNGRSPTSSAPHSRDNSTHSLGSYQNGYLPHHESSPSAGEKRTHSQSEGYPPMPGVEEHPSKRHSGPSSASASPQSRSESAHVSGQSSPEQAYTTHTGAPPLPTSSGADAQSQYPRSEQYPENRDKQQWGAPPPVPTQTSPQQNGGYNSDAHIAEAIQRGTQEMTSPRSQNSEPGYQSSPGQPPVPTSGPSPSTTHSHPVGMTQLLSVQKQRKRNFSNRTKTGCLTCRERKKKCDEAKPQCNNCVKGGFQCKGYQASSAYKASSLLAQTPQQNLQSRSYDPPHVQAPGYAYPPPVGPHPRTHMPPGHTNHHYPPPANHMGMNPPPPINGKHPQGRPPQAPMTAAHPHPQAPLDYPRHGFQEHSRPPHHPEPPNDFRPSSRQFPPPPMGDNYRKEPFGFASPGSTHAPPPPPPPPPVPPMSRPQEHKQPVHQPPKPGEGPIEARDLAALALQQQPGGASGPNVDTAAEAGNEDREADEQAARDTLEKQKVYKYEKEKMLDEANYDHRDPQLVEERRECRKALHSFNSSADSVNFTEGGRRRFIEHFKEILEPKSNNNSQGSPLMNSLQKKGSVGERAEIHTPFDCTYGYNLTIGDDVELGANLTIDDAAQVTIGNNVVIAKNVNLITSQVDFFSGDEGTKKSWRAYPITIEDNVTIEAGATIMPGVTIGRGAVIRSGLRIEFSVQDNTVAIRSTTSPNGFESLAPRAKLPHWHDVIDPHVDSRRPSPQAKSPTP